MNSIRNPKIDIPEKSPFANCKLEREKYAAILKAIVQTYNSGFVLGLDGAWGTGKTTFLKMWKQYLINQDYKCVYINAWENDFVSDPMSMILGELQEQLINNEKSLSQDAKDKFESMLEVLAKISKSVIPLLLSSVLKKSTGTDLAEVIAAATSESVSILTEEVNAHAEKKRGLQEFKEALKAVVDELMKNQQPVVVLVDELDRCNPHFAVKLLERIKHFFDIEGIVFVLSVDAKQLSHSVRGYYGSDKIGGEEYLRRFIDLWYYLPAPNYNAYCTYLYEYYNLGDYFEMTSRLQSRELEDDGDEMKIFPTYLSKANHLSLRQVEKLFIRTKVALNSFEDRQYVLPGVLFLLEFYKEYKPEVYQTILRGDYTIQQLVDEYEEMIPYEDSSNIDERYGWSDVFGVFICVYQKQLNLVAEKRQNILETLTHPIEEGGRDPLFQTKRLDKQRLVMIIEYFGQASARKIVPMSHLVNKLELLDGFVSRT